MKRRDVKKISVAIDVMMDAYHSDELSERLTMAERVDARRIRKQATISSADAGKKLTAIFGDMNSMSNFLCGNTASYLDNTQMVTLKKTIRRLKRDCDDRCETGWVIRDLGAYFTFMAYSLNHGLFGHKLAADMLCTGICLYDIGQQLLPDVFGEVEFQSNEKTNTEQLKIAE